MKTKLTAVCAILVLAAAVTVRADKDKAVESPKHDVKAPAPKPASKEFEKMKSLVGTWKGKADIGQGEQEVTVKYRLMSGGSVLEERILEGTPAEMVTMYYAQDGKLAMTHYCMFGNRPMMKLKSSDAQTITFDFDATCGIKADKESHMHALTIKFDDADTITTTCKGIIDGKEMPDHATTFKRTKS